MKSEHDFRSCNEQLKRLKKNLKISRALHLVIAKVRMRFQVQDWIFQPLRFILLRKSCSLSYKMFWSSNFHVIQSPVLIKQLARKQLQSSCSKLFYLRLIINSFVLNKNCISFL